jgi:carbonic anhydrase/acetyltransferase-like protein (isoleucine patch superfamily)
VKLYLYRTQTQISPFGDDVSDSQVLNQNLSECQRRAARAAGLDWEPIDRPSQAAERPCVLASDRLYFSVKALVDFLGQVRKQSVPSARLALRRSAAVEYSLPLQDVERLDWEGRDARVAYDLWLVDGQALPDDPSQVRAALAASCPALTVPHREITVPVRLPVLEQKQRSYLFPITSTVCCDISHWTHLLWLAHLSLGVGWMERVRSRRVASALALLGSVARQPAVNKWRVLGALNLSGRNCDIHPTAYLEASILGDGVRVGAGACVRNSIIGPDVIVSDHARVTNSVVGQGCLLTEDYFLLNSLCYPGSILGNPRTQMAVIGRDVYLSGWTSLLDAKFVGDVQVLHQGRPVGTGRSFLASCIGHRAVLGARVLIHAGREIPNDLLMVSRPEDVLSVIPPDLPANTPLVRDRGTLVPLDSLRDHSK